MIAKLGGHGVPGRKKSSKNLDQTKFGAILDRDYNSALNHLQKGLQILQLQIQLQLPVERREVTPVETLLESQKQEATVL
jgi:putative transposase